MNLQKEYVTTQFEINFIASIYFILTTQET